MAILDDEGFVWKYHHVNSNTIPASIKEGASVKAGDLIGHVIAWPISSFGERYHYLHLLIVGVDGKYINPFLMMEPLPDTSAPVIQKIGIAKNHRPIEGNQVSGEHALFIEARDLTLHDKYLLPSHKISYRLNGGEEKVVWEFVNLPSGRNDTDYINDFYMKGTCGNYTCRKLKDHLKSALKLTASVDEKFRKDPSVMNAIMNTKMLEGGRDGTAMQSS